MRVLCGIKNFSNEKETTVISGIYQYNNHTQNICIQSISDQKKQINMMFDSQNIDFDLSLKKMRGFGILDKIFAGSKKFNKTFVFKRIFEDCRISQLLLYTNYSFGVQMVNRSILNCRRRITSNIFHMVKDFATSKKILTRDSSYHDIFERGKNNIIEFQTDTFGKNSPRDAGMDKTTGIRLSQ